MIPYFAYGSNLDWDWMAHICPGSKYLSRAYLNNYKITERQFADIDKQRGIKVYGLLWEVTKDHLDSLDHYEGSFYKRMVISVEFFAEKRTILAVTYQMHDKWKTRLDGIKYTPEYRIQCSDAVEHINLPKNVFV